MVCTVLAGLNKWDHCTHLTWNLGHRMMWDHYKHPLSYHFVLCWGWSFLIILYLRVLIWAPKGPMCLWFLQFWRGWTSETIAHTLLEIWVTGWSDTTTSTPYHITLWFVGGDLFSLDYFCGYQYEAPKGSVCLWFVQFCLDRTSETIARILLENWVTDWSETTTSTLSHNTLSIVGMLFSH